MDPGGANKEKRRAPLNIDWDRATTVESDSPVSRRRPTRPPRPIPAGAVHDPSTFGKGPHRGCLYGIDANALPQRIRNSANKYPITAADMEVLIENTGAMCMVCRKCHATVIEHCHTTGRVRGITCQHCNQDRLRIIDDNIVDSFRAAHGSYGFPCWCIDLSQQDGAIEAQRLLAAAHRYIKHAMGIEALDATSAFAILARKPYP